MLKPLAHILEPDARFGNLRYHDQGVGHIRELRIEDLYNDIASLELVVSVPLEIRQHFNAARYAYLYSWFAYDLATVAELQSYTTLEMALRYKLKLAQPQSKQSKLTPLLNTAIKYKWLERNEFDVPGVPGSKPLNYFDVVVKQRNKLTHGALHLDPQFTLLMMNVCRRMINALFQKS
ncbi:MULTISPECIES: hypothetical protein [unclassified Bradyrhizobium]|uniref:hypothetical protein n=1 Tax=unclassified Bradyrhizobium TaxID=2631580 RepID=UPI0028E793E2|nr:MULTISPECIES: hypothetical protein [unclassified Bradyrhizobium]